jgi:hypothetical protein
MAQRVSSSWSSSSSSSSSKHCSGSARRRRDSRNSRGICCLEGDDPSRADDFRLSSHGRLGHEGYAQEYPSLLEGEEMPNAFVRTSGRIGDMTGDMMLMLGREVSGGEVWLGGHLYRKRQSIWTILYNIACERRNNQGHDDWFYRVKADDHMRSPCLTPSSALPPP